MDTCAKGDVALGQVVADLLKRGFNVFLPVSTHACKYDLVAGYKDETGADVLLRIQVKYNGSRHRAYAGTKDPFDLYAIYWPNHDRVSYVWFGNISCATNFVITQEIPNSGNPFYWWEDFQCPKQVYGKIVPKRTAKSMGIRLERNWLKGRESNNRKIKLSDLELQRAVWKRSLVLLAKELGVSDRALGKHVKKRGMVVPPTGYWAKSEAKRKLIRIRYKDQYKAKLATFS